MGPIGRPGSLAGQVRESLERRGLTADMGEPLPIGVGGFVLDRETNVLTFGGRRVVTERRRLSDLLGRAGSTCHVHRAGWLARLAAAQAYDPVLYHSVRDLYEPRPKPSSGRGAEADSYWYADLVLYPAGVLPTGEPFRSLGHWNAPAQVELFQPLNGRVRMLVAVPTAAGAMALSDRSYAAGELCVAPPGAWHLTYPEEPSVAVLNIYAERALPDQAVRGENARKYERGRAVELTYLVDGSSGWRRRCRRPAERWPVDLDLDRLVRAVAGHVRGWLGAWFLTAGPNELLAVEDAVWLTWQEAAPGV